MSFIFWCYVSLVPLTFPCLLYSMKLVLSVPAVEIIPVKISSFTLTPSFCMSIDTILKKSIYFTSNLSGTPSSFEPHNSYVVLPVVPSSWPLHRTFLRLWSRIAQKDLDVTNNFLVVSLEDDGCRTHYVGQQRGDLSGRFNTVLAWRGSDEIPIQTHIAPVSTG